MLHHDAITPSRIPVGSITNLGKFELRFDPFRGLLVLAGLGIGGIVVPASIITTIICPDDLIATVAALTLAIRVIGGSVGYTIYYNVFINKFIPNAETYIGGAMILQLNITSVEEITPSRSHITSGTK